LSNVYTVKISGDETQGRCSIWEIDVPLNNGPPLHKHLKEDEAYYILEGDFSFLYGDKETKAGKGHFVYVHRGRFHTCKNVGSSSGKLLLIITPPQFEKFFEEIGIPIEDKSSFHPHILTSATFENIIKISAKYGVEIKTRD
jgi:mannose-6-phosphate isomerase-like protein (cupin superfamily)